MLTLFYILLYNFFCPRGQSWQVIPLKSWENSLFNGITCQFLQTIPVSDPYFYRTTCPGGTRTHHTTSRLLQHWATLATLDSSTRPFNFFIRWRSLKGPGKLTITRFSKLMGKPPVADAKEVYWLMLVTK